MLSALETSLPKQRRSHTICQLHLSKKAFMWENALWHNHKKSLEFRNWCKILSIFFLLPRGENEVWIGARRLHEFSDGSNYDYIVAYQESNEDCLRIDDDKVEGFDCTKGSAYICSYRLNMQYIGRMFCFCESVSGHLLFFAIVVLLLCNVYPGKVAPNNWALNFFIIFQSVHESVLLCRSSDWLLDFCVKLFLLLRFQKKISKEGTKEKKRMGVLGFMGHIADTNKSCTCVRVTS